MHAFRIYPFHERMPPGLELLLQGGQFSSYAGGQVNGDEAADYVHPSSLWALPPRIMALDSQGRPEDSICSMTRFGERSG